MDKEFKKIFAVSLEGRTKWKAYAVYNGEQLVVQRVLPVKGMFASWKSGLLQELEMRKESGFFAIVEERTDHIARHGHQFDFETADYSDRINLYEALDYYFSLENAGNIIYPKDGAHLRMTENKVDLQRDEKGRAKYNIDWAKIAAGQKAVLLCVVAAVYPPICDTFLELMFGEGEGDSKERDPLRSFKAITRDYDQRKYKKIIGRLE